MIRFILKTEFGDAIANDRYSTMKTVDIEVPELEQLLKSGGFGEMGFERTELLGVEILKESSSED